MSTFHLQDSGIQVTDVRRNPSRANLVQDALSRHDAVLSDQGAVCVKTGRRCGRSPRDKRLVEHPEGKASVWWGPVNQPLRPVSYRAVRQRALDYLNSQPTLYVVDGYLGWDARYRLKVRLVTPLPTHALFMTQLLIEPTVEELARFGQPDFWIFNGGRFPADAHTPDLSSSTCVALDLQQRELVILGTEYAGEMKKGLFTYLNHWLPSLDVLPLHAAANQGLSGDVTLFLGLSGTGKTVLAMEPTRPLVGDDEIGWSRDGVFNLEGGCYAKCLQLQAGMSPSLERAIGFSTLLENVVVDPQTSVVDFADAGFTENTRASFSIDRVGHARIPCVADHPTRIIMLTCDAFGVLPAVCKLNLEQAIDFFQLGYTAHVAEAEVGEKQPRATFSPCFSGPFVVRSPLVYAQLLRERLEEHPAEIWLVNTGWYGGLPGVGKRFDLTQTRAIIDAIHSGALAHASTAVHEPSGYEFVLECPGVASNVLDPRGCWNDKAQYDNQARLLFQRFTATRERLNLVPNKASHWSEQYHRTAY